MTLLLILIPTIFSEVSHSGITRVFHELVKRPMIPEIESKTYAFSNLRGIINALCALENNGLKMTTLSAFHFLVQTPSSSTEKIPTNLGRHTNEFFHHA